MNQVKFIIESPRYTRRDNINIDLGKFIMQGHGLDSPVCGWDLMAQSFEDGYEPCGYITKYTFS
jgi:hypothetical protein